MQWYTTLCCCLGTGLTMASTIALNSLLVSSLQSDSHINLTFEEASWIGQCQYQCQYQCGHNKLGVVMSCKQQDVF